MIYGLGKTGVFGNSAPNVVFVTKDRIENSEISQSMIEIMPSGYGPFFVIDCSKMDADGEAPVYLVSAGGYEVECEKVADSFGEFLLNEVNMLLEET